MSNEQALPLIIVPGNDLNACTASSMSTEERRNPPIVIVTMAWNGDAVTAEVIEPSG